MINWQTLIAEEMQRADDRYGPFASTHEAYGVLMEEVSELFDAIRANKIGSVELEAMQVAAVALRLCLACADGKFRERSVK